MASLNTRLRVGGWGGSVAIRKKINKLFAGLVGPYREIFPSVSKTSLGLRSRAVFETLGNISLYGPLNRQITYIYVQKYASAFLE